MANQYGHKDHHVVAFYAETTTGTGPADWGDDSTRIDVTAVDFTGLLTDLQVDPRMEDAWQKVGQRQLVKGLRNTGNASVSVLFTGNGDAAPADAASPAVGALATLIAHGLGGIHTAPSKTITGGSTTTIEVAAITGWEEGQLVGVQDVTSPTSENTGRVFIRRILSFAATTVTLDEALPFTPANGDLAVGGHTLYLDPAVLVDSTGASGRTLSWYHSGSLADDVIAAYGCAANIALENFGRNALPTMSLDIMVGNWATSTAVAKDDPATSDGESGSIIGRHTSLWIQDYGTSTSTKFATGSIDIQTGITRSRIETVTAAGANLEGMAGYSVAAGEETLITCATAGYTDDWEADVIAGTYKVARYACESSPGSSWAVHLSRAQVRNTPTRAEVSDVSGNNLVLLGCQDSTNASADTAALWESKLVIGLF